MKAFNVLLSILVSVLLFVLALEGGMRLIGMGPKDTINQFDSKLGWVKTPEARGDYDTSEFDVTFTISEQGLRDDLVLKERYAGSWRGMALGDSFVLGYTVNRQDLFVDILERAVKGANDANDIVNAGTEGWSTDQEVLWFLERGKDFHPDVVLLFPYENDLYWNGEKRYSRFPKPRFTPDGRVETEHLVDPGPKPWFERYAVGLPLRPFLAQRPEAARSWSPDGVHTYTGPFLEYAAYFHDAPDFMQDAVARTRAAMAALKKACDGIDAKLVVVPIPHKAAVHPEAYEALQASVGAPANTWSPDRPVDTFLGLADELGIASLDPRPALKRSAESLGELYYAQDWHLNPAGNRAFAQFLQQNLGDALPTGTTSIDPSPDGQRDDGLPTWTLVLAGLWLILGSGYALTYKDENKLLAFGKVGLLLGVIFAIIIGGGQALGSLPPAVGQLVGVLFVLGILGFVLYKLGRRTGTVLELFSAFVKRGHWYLMPLVVVLLTVGSLLVVAASSPLVAPFIYTLF